MSIQRNFKKGQQYWTLGQTIQPQLNFSSKDALFVCLSYTGDGKFHNKQLIAHAKDANTLPQQVQFDNKSEMRISQFSIGWKKYLIGACDIESGFSLYSIAGFGLIFGQVTNSFSTPIDNAHYTLPVTEGNGKFKRLNLDLALGWEIPLGADFFIYAEGRCWLPSSGYPSQYLLVNEKAPLIGIAKAGFRIMF